MDRHLCSVVPLRDIQGWKSNGAWQRGFAARQVAARGWITSHCHGDTVS